MVDEDSKAKNNNATTEKRKLQLFHTHTRSL